MATRSKLKMIRRLRIRRAFPGATSIVDTGEKMIVRYDVKPGNSFTVTATGTAVNELRGVATQKFSFRMPFDL
jgi:hypothetical protein